MNLNIKKKAILLSLLILLTACSAKPSDNNQDNKPKNPLVVNKGEDKANEGDKSEKKQDKSDKSNDEKVDNKKTDNKDETSEKSNDKKTNKKDNKKPSSKSDSGNKSDQKPSTPSQTNKPTAKRTTKDEDKTTSISFKTEYVNDANLDKGKEVVRQKGKNGSLTVRYTYVYENDKLISESSKEISRTNPTNRIIAKGTKEATAAQGRYDSNLEQAIFAATQAEIKKHQLIEEEITAWGASLHKAARIRAKELSQSFGHNRPDGSGWWTVSPDLVAAENLAKGYSNPQTVVQKWMESPSHRSNILSDYDIVAVGVYIDGNGTVYVAQLFG